ncbi:MAG: nitric oxide reductase [Chromatiales bacterium 21-64-14]|nr:MAG: nitric oxide reductase [Chromatiales bacterium 21-64-14]HQU15874.1 cbb3-type cytochrome c oxidase subunit I [Gammaproteobacteria bacterium]
MSVINADAGSMGTADPVSGALKWLLFIVAVGTFTALAWGTYRTYQGAPPIPEQFVTHDGTVVMTAADIVAGKGGFQRADLMDYGSLYGMGSYYGEDYTAEYLVQLGKRTEAAIAEARFGKSLSALTPGQEYQARKEMQAQLQHIRLDTRVAELPNPVAGAIRDLRREIAQNLLANNFAKGWTEAYSLNPKSAAQTADFLIYSSLTTVARRPDGDSSYTNNWPYEPLVGNTPTTSTFIWTWASFMFVFLGFGAVIFIYNRYLSGGSGVHAEPEAALFRGFHALTESQRKTGKFFLIVALVFLAQIAAGTLMAHDYADRTSFYGININYLLPFAFLRDVHIQTPLVWIGVSWIGAALFLAPLISGREPAGQGRLVDLLFWATLVVVGGGLIGDYAGIMGWVGRSWFWIGNQGLSYLQLGRLWQIGFFAGLVIWSVLVFRAMWPGKEQRGKALHDFRTGRIRIEHLFWVSTANVALLYAFGMIPLTGIDKSFTITDFWRWWVVHLWVEQSFEFFAACVSAYLLMATGLVSRIVAERTVLFELVLVFLGGVLGTGHHWYWAGAPKMWVPLGSMFSFIEVLPLLLMVIEAVEQRRVIRLQHGRFPYSLAYTYIIGAAFWNFVGAGVFGGGTLNAPLVNYYEHATFLTLNHAHTALFGAFGLLGIGLVYFCLRYASGDRAEWSDRMGLWAFWLYNLGLLLWIVLNFFPIGWAQLAAVYEHGLAYARSVKFYDTTLLWQWLRFPGDVVFAAGALLMAWDILGKLRPFAQRFAPLGRGAAADTDRASAGGESVMSGPAARVAD